MFRQIDLFQLLPAIAETVSAPTTPRGAARPAPERPWQAGTWRIEPGHPVEYRYPEPTSPAPPAVQGAIWEWNPLVPGWRLHYPCPPFSLAPSGETTDQHGAKLLPPAGFVLINQGRLRGRCPHCRVESSSQWGGPGWGGWADPRIAAAYEAEEVSGRRCYGLTEVDVPGLGRVQPMSHYSRWGAGFCAVCGALSWHDFRTPESAYYRPAAKAGLP
jgi:hypothetical protein